MDFTDKREDYERFAVGEYWRFDPSDGKYHDFALAGDRLVNAVYESIEIEKLEENRLRGYSEAMGLYLCRESGMPRFFDPFPESYFRTHNEAEARAGEERAARMTAERRADEESAGRVIAENRAGAAEARMAEMEAELRRLRRE